MSKLQMRNQTRNIIFFLGIYTTSLPAMVHAGWSIDGLGTLGGSSSLANAINNSGQVVGNALTTSGDIHAFITGSNGAGMKDISSLGGLSSDAKAINDSGQVLGTFSPTDSFVTHAFITDANGGNLTDLGTFGKPNVIVQGMNNSGQVAGFSIVDTSFNFLAFKTGPNGVGAIDLPTTIGGIQSIANAINDSGQVVGAQEFDRSQLAFRAFIMGPDGTGMTDLGTLGGLTSTAFDINNSGQVVGSADAVDNNRHAYVTGPNGIDLTDLGTLGGSFSLASDINVFGEVVGSASTTNNKETHAFLFSHGGITDLTLLDPVLAGGWSNITIRDINDHGQMIGVGTNIQGNQEAFLLSYTPDTIFNPIPIFIPPSPIPEPESYAMLLAGLGLLGFIMWRRERIDV